MADLTRATKAELLDEVTRLRALVDAKPVPRQTDAEAAAIDRCVAALNSLIPKPSSTSSYSLYSSPPITVDIGGVLRYLARRYSVSLIEVQTEPCKRAHVDELGLIDPRHLPIRKDF